MPAPLKPTKPEKAPSYLDSLNPWSSRSVPPTPSRDAMPQTPTMPSRPADHSTSHLYGRSLRSYPPDCPPIHVMWYHAIDNPKRKPQFQSLKKPLDEKPLPPAKKYLPFSNSDSRALEAAYQELLEKSEDRFHMRPRTGTHESLGDEAGKLGTDSGVKVPVNEDYLFDVDIAKRELTSVYWEGPVYEVRRGTWFTQEGSKLVPCEENLAAQLEEGYLKVKPWTYILPPPKLDKGSAKTTTPKPSTENLKVSAAEQKTAEQKMVEQQPTPTTPQSHRLFGTYMNNVATYQDKNTAWLSSDGVLSWVTSAVYGTFAGGGHLSGVKLIRGYQEPRKTKEKDDKIPVTPVTPNAPQDDKAAKTAKRRSVAIFGNKELEAPSTQDEELQKQQEAEMRNDYNDENESQSREIEHLVLVTHGIGQMLSLRMESINFIHDVNLLRKSIKQVYSSSADLKALNGDLGMGSENCRVQVLPVCWRHLLDFPKQKHKHREKDIGDVSMVEEDEYPSLDDITVEGVAFARSLMSDLALDVLLYQSGYREQIIKIVLQESNNIVRLFKQRNPNFKGKVHIMGHSLGSAIMFDILCRQKQESIARPSKLSQRMWHSRTASGSIKPQDKEPGLEFEVSDLYCLGSPIGLFQMLRGKTIAARQNGLLLQNPMVIDLEDPDYEDQRVSPITGLPHSVSSPKVEQLFNIIHPSDPIAYRLEPLISPAFKSLKPQNLPYTKKGIFGSVAPQGLSSIGVKVGQSVSGLWSSFSSGITTSLINRSLGLTNDEVARLNASSNNNNNDDEVDKAVTAANKLGELTNARKQQLANPSSSYENRPSMSGNELTLIDDELETLYSKFQKTREKAEKEVAKAKDKDKDKLTDAARISLGLSRNADGEWEDLDKKSKKVRREEQKTRALNRNSRVDFTIQEGVLDYNPINAIASHMSYWADEDVNHFFLSQILANKSGRSSVSSSAGGGSLAKRR